MKINPCSIFGKILTFSCSLRLTGASGESLGIQEIGDLQKNNDTRANKFNEIQPCTQVLGLDDAIIYSTKEIGGGKESGV